MEGATNENSTPETCQEALPELLHPTLTSVVIPVEDIARRVIDRTLRQLETGPDAEPRDHSGLAAHRGEHATAPWTSRIRAAGPAQGIR